MLALPGMVAMWAFHKLLGEEDIDALTHKTPSKRGRQSSKKTGASSKKSRRARKDTGSGGGAGGSSGGNGAGGGAGGGDEGSGGGDRDPDAPLELPELDDEEAARIEAEIRHLLQSLHEYWPFRHGVALQIALDNGDVARVRALEAIHETVRELLESFEVVLERRGVNLQMLLMAVQSTVYVFSHFDLLTMRTAAIAHLATGRTDERHGVIFSRQIFQAWLNNLEKSAVFSTPRHFAEHLGRNTLTRFEAQFPRAAAVVELPAADGEEIGDLELTTEEGDTRETIDFFGTFAAEQPDGAGGAPPPWETGDDSDDDDARESSAKRARPE